MSDSPFTLTFFDLADRLGVTYSRVYGLYNRHGSNIPAEKRGQRLYFRADAVKAFRSLMTVPRSSRPIKSRR